MIAAVHHAEVVAHRVGEPFGTLILAIAVTVIEVALIVTLMISGGPDNAALARDTVFAAFMIVCNGVMGLRQRPVPRYGRPTTTGCRPASIWPSARLWPGIGLTIPAIAVASIWLTTPLTLGLEAKEIVLLALTLVVGTLTLSTGRATLMQGTVHLSIFSAFLFLAFLP